MRVEWWRDFWQERLDGFLSLGHATKWMSEDDQRTIDWPLAAIHKENELLKSQT